MKKAGIFQLAALVVALCLFPSNAFGIYPGGASAKGVSPGGPGYKEGEVLVKFHSGIKATAMEGVQSRLGLKTLKRFSQIGVHHLSIERSGLTVKEAVRLLRQSPEVLYAEPNYRRYITRAPNDPEASELWGMHNIGQSEGTADADIDAPEAWDITTGSADIVVAVIDTGVDYTHPDLFPNMWRNTGEVPGNLIDDDRNGYVDDVFGIDALNEDSNPFDDVGHGTHVSGTIGAVGNNGVGVVGVNWNVKIMALKFLGALGGWDDGAIECLNYVLMMKNTYGVNIRLTSNSWGGGDFSQALEDAIAATGSAGMLFVAAAGNDTKNNDYISHYPSNYDLANVIAVAATDRIDDLAYFSNYGAASVDLGAPGYEILSTTPRNTYSAFGGTSMAVPHVAGAAALVWADNPSLTIETMKEILLSEVDLIPALDGKTVSGGRLNVYNALTCDSGGVRFAISLRDGFTAEEDVPITLSARLLDCGYLRGVTMTVGLSNGDPTVTLLDNGLAPDASANDGVYTGSWTPNAIGPVTATFTAMQGGNTYVASVSSEVVLFTGYYSDDTVPYNWIEISSTGTRLSVAPTRHAYVDAQFALKFYDAAYRHILADSNGLLYFDSDDHDIFPSHRNNCIPSSNTFGVGMLASPFWTDLDIHSSPGGGVYYEVLGTSPNRMLVVEYADVPHDSIPGTVSFEIIFYEDRPDILMQYRDVTLSDPDFNLGAGATIGLQRDFSYGQQYSCNEASLSNQMAILWYRNLADEPTISRSPVSLSASCEIGTNASSQTFEVWNWGAGNVSYTITDDVGWLDCTPAVGNSTGEHDTITVNYTTSALGLGDHSATITITDPGAPNSPQSINVSLAVNLPSHTLTTNVSPAGTGSVSGGGPHLENSVATVQAIPNAQWAFSHWSGAGIEGSTANPESVTMDSDKTVTAIFFYDSVLSRIDLSFPRNESLMHFAPAFRWTDSGGTDNRYAVDLALSLSGPVFPSPILRDTAWTIPDATWNRIPAGSYVYWRVRGADLDRVPLTIIGSYEVWWFYKY